MTQDSILIRIECDDINALERVRVACQRAGASIYTEGKRIQSNREKSLIRQRKILAYLTGRGWKSTMDVYKNTRSLSASYKTIQRELARLYAKGTLAAETISVNGRRTLWKVIV